MRYDAPMSFPEGPWDAPTPRQYSCPKIDHPIVLTGRMDDPQWAIAPWTSDFVDIMGDAAPRPRFNTRAKMLWSDEHLYVGARIEEPHVWATLHEHDSVIFNDNDFEIFLDPDCDGHLYSELEINALNTTWDLMLTKPYRVNGAAIDGFELHGLKTAVHIDGTLNDTSDEDRGWTVEFAIPWTALKDIARRSLPPKPRDYMKINFSRVEWEIEIVNGKYRKIPGKSEDNWVWSPQGVVDMHRPHRWGILHFVEKPGDPIATLAPERTTLMRVYDAQYAYRARYHQWAATLEELGFSDIPGLRIEHTSNFLEISLGTWHVDHDSRLWQS